MMWKTALALVLMTGPALADADQWGNPYPPQCSKEALAHVYITVVAVTAEFLLKATNAEGRFGVYMPSGAAGIRNDLTGYSREDAIRHEKCHKVAGLWHKDQHGN